MSFFLPFETVVEFHYHLKTRLEVVFHSDRLPEEVFDDLICAFASARGIDPYVLSLNYKIFGEIKKILSEEGLNEPADLEIFSINFPADPMTVN